MDQLFSKFRETDLNVKNLNKVIHALLVIRIRQSRTLFLFLHASIYVDEVSNFSSTNREILVSLVNHQLWMKNLIAISSSDNVFIAHMEDKVVFPSLQAATNLQET